jgi:hypothetical protein
MRWIVMLAAAAVLVVVGIALAARGGGEEEKAAGADLTAIRCPLVSTGEMPGGAERYEPAEGAFDTTELIGMPLDDARAKAADHGCEIVVSLADGKGLPVPIDIDPKRIYVYTEDDVVTEIEGVGGGI